MAETRALITGATGFVGSHLVEFLRERDVEIFGTVRWRSNRENLDHLSDDVELIYADLTDAPSLGRCVEMVEPDLVFHLAAQSFVPTSWKLPVDTVSTNVTGTVNLLEAVRQSSHDPRIQICGSSEEYGLVHPEETPITEKNELRPLSPYAVSKVTCDLLGYQYHQSYGMKIVRTRGFNHEGPRRGEDFVTSTFAKQIAEIEAGKKDPVIHVGNLSAQRDYTDVRDMVEAYWLALQFGEFGEVYNICSGEAWEIRRVLDTLLEFTDVEVSVEAEDARMRPSDVPLLLGDATKFRKQTGWSPKIPFEVTLEDTLDYWRERVRV